MQKEVTIKGIEKYNKKLFFAKLEKEIEEAEEDIKNGNVFRARDVFRELRQKYGF